MAKKKKAKSAKKINITLTLENVLRLAADADVKYGHHKVFTILVPKSNFKTAQVIADHLNEAEYAVGVEVYKLAWGLSFPQKNGDAPVLVFHNKNSDNSDKTFEPYKFETFEVFLAMLKKSTANRVILGTWASIAGDLGVNQDTITKWKTHPEAQRLIKEAKQHALDMMIQAGSNDWKMWEKQAKMLGVDFGDQKLDVTSGGEPITFGWKK